MGLSRGACGAARLEAGNRPISVYRQVKCSYRVACKAATLSAGKREQVECPYRDARKDSALAQAVYRNWPMRGRGKACGVHARGAQGGITIAPYACPH
jgi:hypothetical protein